MTRIADLLAAGRTFSFEFFPPKNDAEQATLVRTLRDLEPLEPSFVSVTYRGGRESRRRTTDLVVGMLHATTLTPMAHLTCAGASRDEVDDLGLGAEERLLEEAHLHCRTVEGSASIRRRGAPRSLIRAPAGAVGRASSRAGSRGPGWPGE